MSSCSATNLYWRFVALNVCNDPSLVSLAIALWYPWILGKRIFSTPFQWPCDLSILSLKHIIFFSSFYVFICSFHIFLYTSQLLFDLPSILQNIYLSTSSSQLSLLHSIFYGPPFEVLFHLCFHSLHTYSWCGIPVLFIPLIISTLCLGASSVQHNDC